MNTLTLIIYIAGIVQPLTFLFGFVFFIVVCYYFVGFDKSDISQFPFYGLMTNNFYKTPLIIGVISLFLAIAIPSKQTVYLMAASEIGEDALKSQRMEKILDIIDKELDQMISKRSEKN